MDSSPGCRLPERARGRRQASNSKLPGRGTARRRAGALFLCTTCHGDPNPQVNPVATATKDASRTAVVVARTVAVIEIHLTMLANSRAARSPDQAARTQR